MWLNTSSLQKVQLNGGNWGGGGDFLFRHRSTSYNCLQFAAARCPICRHVSAPLGRAYDGPNPQNGFDFSPVNKNPLHMVTSEGQCTVRRQKQAMNCTLTTIGKIRADWVKYWA